MDYATLTLAELKKGYSKKERNALVCNYCGKAFHEGQIYPAGGNLYDSERAVERHIEAEHGGNVSRLLDADTKYNTLTDIQKKLLTLFNAGLSDGEIAKQTGISASTVRHQKFTFREKAKQAKLYLAIFERVFENKTKSGDDIVPIHNGATFIDDRYVTTEQEREHILENAFESLDPPVLKVFSSKEKKKVVILAKIAGQFERGKKYSEKEVNETLKPIYDDYVMIRRFLIIYGFMERSADGSEYWLTS
ncbi:MAG: DUF2087 domain-containing protein [Clostridiales bacterium]|jgi:hypothetical protein|nr:DUF2087 domain-containing protein [Clostridiales bacterium]